MLMNLGVFGTRWGQGRLASERAKAEMRGLQGVLNLEFTGPDGGGYHVRFDDGRVIMGRGLGQDARATIKMKPEDYLALVAGDLSYSVARMTGKVRCSGDGNFGLVFGAFFEQMRTAQTAPGLRGTIARKVIGRALRKGGYQRKQAAGG